jgi:4-hydroxybenzoate polyprenyltransferase
LISAIIQNMRPRQWTKNLFVFAGLLFTLDRPHPTADYVKAGLAFVIFCVLSGAIYIINDILDAERDRKRPIASGRLSTTAAWTAVVVLLPIGVAASFALNAQFGRVAAVYVLLLTAYSLFLRDIVILDVMTVAGGFVLRAVAGAAAIEVGISPWLLVCTILIALFLGLAKRRGELLGLGEVAASHRSSLGQYSVPLLDQFISVAAASTIIAYSLYTFFSETGFYHPYMMATLPFVIYGVFRYLLLIHKGKGAANPEVLLLADKPLLIDICLWAVACALIIVLPSLSYRP